MTKTEAIDLFGSPGDTARALGISRQAVWLWPNELGNGTVSRIVTALMIEKRSKEAGEIIKRYLK